MKDFQFSMESVLNYRQSYEDQKKEELAKAIQKAKNEEKILTAYQHKKENCKQSKNNISSDIIFIQQYEAYTSYLDSCIEKQKEKVQEFYNQVKLKRKELNQAAKNRKILENLKEKRLQEHNSELLKKEQEMLDEVGVAAYCRRAE